MAVSLTARLDEVQTAISRVLTGGQEYEIGGGGEAGRRMKRANLAELRAMESDLLRRIARETGGGGRVRVVVPEF